MTLSKGKTRERLLRPQRIPSVVQFDPRMPARTDRRLDERNEMEHRGSRSSCSSDRLPSPWVSAKVSDRRSLLQKTRNELPGAV